LPISDWSRIADVLFNRQLAIDYRKSSRLFLAALTRASLKRASLVTLSELTTRPAPQRTLIGAQSGAAINGQDALNFSVWARNYVNTYQLADSARRRGSGVSCCLHRTDVSTNKDRHVPGANVLFS
jgi:hypothetical protein